MTPEQKVASARLRDIATYSVGEKMVAELEEIDELRPQDSTPTEFRLVQYAISHNIGAYVTAGCKCGNNIFVTNWIPQFKWEATNQLTETRLAYLAHVKQ